MTASADAAQLGINPFGRNVRLLLPPRFGADRAREPDRSLKSSGWATNTSKALLSGAVASDEPALLAFPMVFLHVVITRTSTGGFRPTCS
jgi:hypothetical protein